MILKFHGLNYVEGLGEQDKSHGITEALSMILEFADLGCTLHKAKLWISLSSFFT